MVDLITERNGCVTAWIGECECLVDMSYEEAVEAVDRANS